MSSAQSWEEKLPRVTVHQVLDGVSIVPVGNQGDAPSTHGKHGAGRSITEEQQAAGLIRRWRSTRTPQPSRRPLSGRWFHHSEIVDQRSFHVVFQGAEMETPRPNASFVETSGKSMCSFLRRVTINTFAVPLGLSSQAQLWGVHSKSYLMASALGGRPRIANVVQWTFWTLSLGLLIVIGLLYMAKIALHWSAVRREWAHPVRSSFAATPILTALTLIVAEPPRVTEALHPSTAVPFSVFLVLGGFMLYLEMALYGKWLFDQSTSLNKANPSYQIAVVGNFLLASVGNQVSGSEGAETACAEISLVFFSVGILYQLMVFMAIQQSSASNIAPPPPAVKTSAINSVKPGAGGEYAGGKRELESSTEDCEAGLTARGQVPFERDIGRKIKPYLEEIPTPTHKAPSYFPSTLQPALSRLEVGMNVATGVTEVEELKAGCCDVDSHRRTDGASAFSSSGGISRPTIIPARIKEEESVSGQENGDSATMDRKVNDEEILEHIHHRGDDEDNAFSSSSISSQSRIPASKTDSAADPTPLGIFTNKKLHPMYFLFVAPPAAASIAWKGISGDFDMFAKCLFFISGFLYMFIALFNSSFLKGASFSIAWWAYTFPSSTFSVAALLYAEKLDVEGVAHAAFVLSLASTLMVLLVFAKTVFAALKGELFVPDPVLSVCLPDSVK